MRIMPINVISVKSNSLENNSNNLSSKSLTHNNIADSFPNSPSFKWFQADIIGAIREPHSLYSEEEYALAKKYAKMPEYSWFSEYKSILEKRVERADFGTGWYDDGGFARGVLGVCSFGLSEVVNGITRTIDRNAQIRKRNDEIRRIMQYMKSFVEQLREGKKVRIVKDGSGPIIE